MKIAIVDDNEIEQEIIFDTLKTYSDIHKTPLDIKTFSDGDSFFHAYESDEFHLIFMDIFLKGQSGIDIVRTIREADPKVLIVFLTTSAEHIFEAAPFHFFDYILKPFEFEHIFHVLDDALEVLPPNEAELSFEYRSLDVHFPLSKIQYIYSNNHEVIIQTTQDSQSFRLPFYSITNNLDDSRFLQCNRGIMLNMDYIKAMESDYFEMADSKCFPIKTKGRKQIRDQYMQYQFLKLQKR